MRDRDSASLVKDRVYRNEPIMMPAIISRPEIIQPRLLVSLLVRKFPFRLEVVHPGFLDPPVGIVSFGIDHGASIIRYHAGGTDLVLGVVEILGRGGFEFSDKAGAHVDVILEAFPVDIVFRQEAPVKGIDVETAFPRVGKR